jgi:putative transposase
VKKTRFTEAQIVAILRELDAGVPVAELARKHGIHANTIRLWRDKYGGMETSDLAKLRQLQDENRRKDRIIARMALEIDAMKELVEKKPGALAETRSREGALPTWNLGSSSLRSDQLQPQQSLLLPRANRRRADRIAAQGAGR